MYMYFCRGKATGIPIQGESSKGNTSLQFFLSALRYFSKPLCLISDVYKPVHLRNFIPLVQCVGSNSKQSMLISSPQPDS